LLFGLLALAVCSVAFTAGWLISVASGTPSARWSAGVAFTGAVVSLVWGLLHIRSARTFGPEIAQNMRRRGLVTFESVSSLERQKTRLVIAIGVVGTLLGIAGFAVSLPLLT
jgi:hypothetical protein